MKISYHKLCATHSAIHADLTVPFPRTSYPDGCDPAWTHQERLLLAAHEKFSDDSADLAAYNRASNSVCIALGIKQRYGACSDDPSNDAYVVDSLAAA